MPLSNDIPKTAWSDTHAYIGDIGEQGALPSDWTDLGSIDENALALRTEDGTEYQLKDINGKLLDTLRQEPTLHVDFTLLKPSEVVRGKFWSVEEEGVGDKRIVKVASLVPATHFSFKFDNPKVIGSESFIAPEVVITMKPNWAPDKGFSAECTATLIMGQLNYLFGFGKVTS